MRPSSKKHAAETHILKDSIPLISSRDDLLKGQRVHHDHLHEVVFMIQQRNMDELTRILHDVSDPESENYGQHMTMKEVVEMTSNPEGRNIVLSYLQMNGATTISETINGEYITATAPISVWERLFNTDFYTFHQTQTDGKVEAIIRAEDYSIPVELGPHVMHVLNTIDTPLITHSSKDGSHRVKKPTAKTEKSKFRLAGDWQAVSPRKIRIFYNMSNYQGSEKSTQAIYTTAGQNFSPKDLTRLQTEYSLKIQSAIPINGHDNDTVCVVNHSQCGESNLDIQYIMATSQASPSYHWYVPGDFTYFLILVAEMVNPPLVLSISWGAYENLVSPGGHDAFTFQAIKLGVMGITIFVASGDDGANSGYARDNTAQCGYRPSWPATNPYIVSVGATSGLQLEPIQPEKVCQGDTDGVITTGGGFSGYYPMPYWQTNAISSYFTSAAAANQSPVAGYAVSGRGFPDISLAGVNYAVYMGGQTGTVCGTSASSPAVAGFFSNINAARMAIGKGSVGWVNPALYAHGASFMNDITSGHNKCVIGGTCCPQGFYAAPGWDPACGLGSPNYGKMHQILVKLGSAINGAAVAPTFSPTTSIPSRLPTPTPTVKPTSTPSTYPTQRPSYTPTSTAKPTSVPTTLKPTNTPSSSPTNPTMGPTLYPTVKPSISHTPTTTPSFSPSYLPTLPPPASPTTLQLSFFPTTFIPTLFPTTAFPTFDPSPSVVSLFSAVEGTSVTVITASVVGSFFATIVIIIFACLCVIWKSNSLRKGRAVYTHDVDIGPDHDNIPELDASIFIDPASPSFHNLSKPISAHINI